MKKCQKKDAIYLILSVCFLLTIIIFGNAGSPKVNQNNKPAVFYPFEKTAVSYSPRGEIGGGTLSASCESGYEHYPGECAASSCPRTCTTAANACGMTATGCSYDNGSTCSASIPSDSLCPSSPPPSSPPSPPPPPPPPSFSLSVNSSTLGLGGQVTVSWDGSGASSCTIDHGIGSVNPTSGSTNLYVNQTTTYTLSCTGPGGSRNFSTTVNVGLVPKIIEILPRP